MTSTRLSVVPAATGGCCINKQHFAVDRENVTLHSLYFLFLPTLQVLQVLMTRSTTTIVEKFRPKATTWGERWFETLDHQHWEMSANCGLLVDGDNFVADAHHSFGHRVAKKGAPTCHPEACLSVTDWYDHYAKDRFTVWNGDSAQEGVLRLHQMHTADVGSALIVARSSPGSPPYITIVSGPVTTPVDLDDTRNHGAPDGTRLFKMRLMNFYCPRDLDRPMLLLRQPRITLGAVSPTPSKI